MRIRPNKRAIAVLSAVAAMAGLGVAAATVASADESGPSVEELLRDCGVNTDYCQFTVTGSRDILGERRQVSDALYNCSPDDQTYEKDWSDTTTNTVNVGLEISAEAGFAQVYKVTFKTTFGYEWSSSRTVTDKAPIKVKSGWVGWIERAPSLTEVTGKYELHYGDRKAGHYYWYVDNVTFTGPTQDARGNLLAQARPMTDVEKSSYCADPPGDLRRLVNRATRMEPGSAVESTPLN